MIVICIPSCRGVLIMQWLCERFSVQHARNLSDCMSQQHHFNSLLEVAVWGCQWDRAL